MIVPNKKIPCYPNCLVNISLMLSMFRARNWTVLKPRVKVSSSYDPLAYFSDIFISGKNENTGKICKWIIT